MLRKCYKTKSSQKFGILLTGCCKNTIIALCLKAWTFVSKKLNKKEVVMSGINSKLSGVIAGAILIFGVIHTVRRIRTPQRVPETATK